LIFSVRKLIDADGPTVDLSIGLGRTRFPQSKGPIGPPGGIRTVRALIDTGADITAVHPQLLADFEMGFLELVEIARPGQPGVGAMARLYDVRISIAGPGDGSAWIRTTVVAVQPASPSILAILGRDVLQLGTLFYDGPAGEFTLSF